MTGGPPRPGRRWMIVSLLSVGVLVNYLDRINLSVSEAALHDEFGISKVTFGFLLGAYSWSYAALQMPMGALLDRYGVQIIGRLSTFLWSAASFAASLATGINGLVAARLLLGVGEAATFPASAKAVAYWFPTRERSFATALFDSASKLGAAIGVPLIGVVLLRFGWRTSFALTGFISLVYFCFFFRVYRNPSADMTLSSAERRMLSEGGATPESYKAGNCGASLTYLLRQRKVIGLSIGFASYNYTFYLLLTWLPSYLSFTMHIDLLHSVIISSVPWIVATVADLLVGGWMVDLLVRRGRDASRVRKTVLVTGTAGGLAVFGAAYAINPNTALTWISIAIGGLSAAAPVGWSIPALIAPKDSVGRVGGILNFFSQLAAISAPIATGFIVAASRSFFWAFAGAGLFILIGMLSYLLLLGRIEAVPDPVAHSSQ